MMPWPVKLLAVIALTGTAGCQGASDVDYSTSRGISADIAASRDIGPTAQMPGITQSGEPLGAIPWNLDQRH